MNAIVYGIGVGEGWTFRTYPAKAKPSGIHSPCTDSSSSQPRSVASPLLTPALPPPRDRGTYGWEYCTDDKRTEICGRNPHISVIIFTKAGNDTAKAVERTVPTHQTLVIREAFLQCKEQEWWLT